MREKQSFSTSRKTRGSSSMRRKGIALPLETVVLLILSGIVLAAMLGFFLGVFNPAQTEVELTRKQFTICQEISTKGCSPGKITPEAEQLAQRDLIQGKICTPTTAKQVRPTCNGNSARECISSCCRIFCG